MEKIYKITWLDAVGEDTGWIDRETVKKEVLVPVHTVGFLVSEKEDCITLGMSYEPTNDNIAAYLTIPKLLIVKIDELMV